MAIIYLRSTDGSDADNGSTWALAKATLTGAYAAAAAGDTIYVSQAHAETFAGNITFASPNNIASPVKVICVNDAAEPPTTLATGASFTATATGVNFILSGSYYMYGLTFNAGAGLSFGATAGISSHVLENCDLRVQNTGSSGAITTSSTNNGQKTVLINCTYRFSGAGNTFKFSHGVEIRGGSFIAGTSSPTALFQLGDAGKAGPALVSGMDFSNLGSGFDWLLGATAATGDLIVRNAKLPAGWAGDTFSAAPGVPGLRLKLHNADSADTRYRFIEEDYYGQVRPDIAVYRDGGATDGTTPVSWRMASSAGSSYPSHLLISPELPALWNTTVGTPVTATVEIVHDGASPLNDDEVWLEVQYLGTSGFPLSSFITDRKGLLATAAAQASSSVTWTGDSGTGPNGSATWNTRKLECTFTPQEAGYIQARVYLAKPSTVVFVDPKITVA